MRSNEFNKRLTIREARSKPRFISTMADFVMWRAEDEPDEDVELSPQMQEFVDETLKHRQSSCTSASRGSNRGWISVWSWARNGGWQIS